MLQVNRVSAAYDEIQVLWDVSLEVNKGEIVGLVGANGAGKTTLLRTLAGLHRPQGGVIYFDGQEITSDPAHRKVERGLALVPEGRRLFPYMTVEENLLVGGFIKRARNNRKAALEHVYELFPRLAERRNQQAGTLSGGEQQMLAIGRALMSKPRLLMLDETSLGLAPVVVRDIFRLVQDLRTREGFTILLVEQNVQQCLQIADRAYVIENGRIVLEGSGQELMHNPHLKEHYLGI